MIEMSLLVWYRTLMPTLTLSQASTTTSGLAQDSGARRAQNNSLGVAKDSANV
jgi:hypothetical protein